MTGKTHRFCIGWFTLTTSLLVGTVQSDQPPNFLVILADDCTHSDLPIYGGQNARTPNLDAFARQSLVFQRAYVSEAMCQPCRSELYSGQHPVRNGAAWNHSGSRPQTTSLPHHLKPLGYRVGLAGKTHIRPAPAFPFESVAGFDANCVRNPTRQHSTNSIRAFMTRDRQQPFCLVVALVEPHVPWVMGDASQYPEAQLKLPPYLADTQVTRNAFSRYLAEITYMDRQVGEILEVLAATQQADRTVVLFSSEQGAQFPGCKWTNWDCGLHTALVVRWPGKIPAGKRTDAIVQYADIAPTLVELAGGNVADHPYDGTSFAKTLTAPERSHRRFAYGVHNNVPEGPAYPIRTVTNGTYRYIRNLLPEEIYIEKHLMGMKGDGQLNNPYWATWMFHSERDPQTEKLVKRYMKRPPEALYHTASDPYELKNLVDDPNHAAVLAELRRELDRWMQDQGDPGAAMDRKQVLEAARKGKHPF